METCFSSLFSANFLEIALDFETIFDSDLLHDGLQTNMVSSVCLIAVFAGWSSGGSLSQTSSGAVRTHGRGGQRQYQLRAGHGCFWITGKNTHHTAPPHSVYICFIRSYRSSTVLTRLRRDWGSGLLMCHTVFLKVENLSECSAVKKKITHFFIT